MSLTIRVIVALIAGLAAGLIVLAHPTPLLLKSVSVIEPIGALWVNAIRMTVIPLVFSILITGVASSASVNAIRTIGWRTLATFLSLHAFVAAAGLLIVPPLFTWLRVDSGTVKLAGANPVSAAAKAANVPSFAEWIVSVVPINPIKAAADGAMLPLVVFAFAFAVALLGVPAPQRDAVLLFFGGVRAAMLAIVRLIIDVAPVGVFALMLPVASRTGVAVVGALGYYVVALVVTMVLVTLLFYAVVVFVARIPVLSFARAAFPAQAVAFSTSSSLASLPALLDSSEKRLQLPPSVTGMVLPLAVSTFKASTGALWLVAAIFLARLYGVPLAPFQLAIISLTGILTSFSSPGVPHGWLLVISPLVATMGIPAEGVGLLIAVDTIPDLFVTVTNVTADLVAAALVSKRWRHERATSV